MNNESSSNGVLIGIIIVVIIGIVGFLAYKQGVFTGKSQDNTSGGVQIQLGGSSPSPSPSN